MSEHKLWIAVSDDGLKAHSTLIEAVSTFDNLAEFVVNKGKIVCLTYSPDSEKSWELDAVALEEIAKTMIKRMEK